MPNSHNDNGGSPWLRQPPSQIIERREGGLELDVTVPTLQALLPGLSFVIALCVSIVALWASAPTLHWLALVIVGTSSIILHVKYEEPGRALLAVCSCGVVGWALGRLLAWWFTDWGQWDRLTALGFAALACGAWLVFGLLTMCFFWELFQRSGAMEQYGWSGFFDWLFAYHLRQPVTPEPGRELIRLELVRRQADGNAHRVDNLDLPVTRAQIVEIAAMVLAGAPFTERRWAGKNRLLTVPDFRKLRQVLLDQGFVVYKVEGHPKQGVEFTGDGVETLRALVAPVAEAEDEGE